LRLYSSQENAEKNHVKKKSWVKPKLIKSDFRKNTFGPIVMGTTPDMMGMGFAS